MTGHLKAIIALKEETVMSKRIRFVIVEFSPECMIAKKGFDEKSVVARVGQPRVLQKKQIWASL